MISAKTRYWMLILIILAIGLRGIIFFFSECEYQTLRQLLSITTMACLGGILILIARLKVERKV